MIFGETLTDGVVVLRCLRKADVTPRYLGWLWDPDVNAYLEVRHNLPNTLADLEAFVHDVNISSNQLILGIFRESDDMHVGNIKLGPVDWKHSRAEVGILIGEKAVWGQGIATRSIELLAKFAAERLHMQRLTAGCYEENTGSRRAFEKAGFALEAALPDYWVTADGRRVGGLILGSSPDQFTKGSWNAGVVDGLCFVGGGDLMVKCILDARRMGFQVAAILSPRHVEEVSQDSRLSIGALLEENRIEYSVANTAAEAHPSGVFTNTERVLGIGFGPAWVLPSDVLRGYGCGFVNFNGIPLPHYLGGAHYSWQILNHSRQGGNYIQEVSDDVDRGDLLMEECFELSSEAVIPQDYFVETSGVARRFVAKFLARVKDREDFDRRPFAQIEAQRLYFPRLDTLADGWINWSWTAKDIESFCNAFSWPYSGASTEYKQDRLFLHRVRVASVEGSESLHPYCAGLIVRSTPVEVIVAAVGGFLVLDEWSFAGVQKSLREGERLFTPQSRLATAPK
jgi:RimJ/RimL family protein N-acetyltransferase/methionyl-tRNA formyltransferase